MADGIYLGIKRLIISILYSKPGVELPTHVYFINTYYISEIYAADLKNIKCFKTWLKFSMLSITFEAVPLYTYTHSDFLPLPIFLPVLCAVFLCVGVDLLALTTPTQGTITLNLFCLQFLFCFLGLLRVCKVV
jgi:hypothetical protein